LLLMPPSKWSLILQVLPLILLSSLLVLWFMTVFFREQLMELSSTPWLLLPQLTTLSPSPSETQLESSSKVT
jgi:uncharacterized protein YqhQ